jgi:transposase
MIGWRKRVLLRHYLDEGMSKTDLAAKLGISVRTIYHWIETGQLDRDLAADTVCYGPRPPVPTKLDPFKGIVLARLEQYPKLTAVRLFDEIKTAGYPGGYTQLKEYVREVRPMPPEEPVVRFETPPGRQAQVDFADFKLPWGKRYALLVVLGYSRQMWVQFYTRKTMQVVRQGLEAALCFFGGVPKEMLFDQMKGVILDDKRDEDGPLLENPEFLRFAHHWGFRVRACRPYRAKTKGKVERPVGYVRSNFFYGRTFVSDADLNDQAERWYRTVANPRIHGTLKERPVDRFDREREFLRPLAARPYRSLVLPHKTPKAKPRVLPSLEVERRPLEAYAQAVGGGR